MEGSIRRRETAACVSVNRKSDLAPGNVVLRENGVDVDKLWAGMLRSQTLFGRKRPVALLAKQPGQQPRRALLRMDIY
jgi:hypothetical protein